MAYGLEVYDANGQKILSINDRIQRFVMKVSGTLNRNQSVFIPVPGYVDDGTWCITQQLGYQARVVINSGNGGFTISYSFGNGTYAEDYNFLIFRV